MPCRNRERVAMVLAHEEADRVPVAWHSPDAEVATLVDSMDLDDDHRAFCSQDVTTAEALATRGLVRAAREKR